MMKATKALTLSLLAISCLANPNINLSEELKPLWNSWKVYHDKEYTLPAEETARFAIFVENYKKVVSFNAENNGVKLALNSFADLTAEEFKAIYVGGYQPRPHQHPVSHVDYGVLSLPDSVDWRKKGAVTPVENQGQCGSCWAFSTVGALEGLYFIDSGKLLEFSEQQIIDCDTDAEGCNGGFPDQAFEYTAKYGIETLQDYPYSGGQGTCKYDASKAIHVNSGYKDVTHKSTEALKAALVVQPVAIAIEADQSVFQFYSSGVVSGNSCGDNLDHAVLAVGYMSVSGVEAFIVKNSWGANWGDQGYVYISTNGSVNQGNGVCGILAEPAVPTA